LIYIVKNEAIAQNIWLYTYIYFQGRKCHRK